MSMEMQEPTNEYLSRLEESKGRCLSDEDYMEKGEITFPYVYQMSADGKVLTGYGTEHTNDIQHPMFGDMKAQFEKSNPDMVFIVRH